jgi:uncharacterized protein (TIGR02268 family)
VPLASLASLLILTLLSSPAEGADLPRLDECERAAPRIELTAESTERVPMVCVSSGQSMTLHFDSPLLSESVEIQQRERFADVAVGQRTLTLMPPENLLPGERFTARVRFADGAAPASATFLLMGHPALGARQVDVLRQPRTVAYYQQRAKEAHAETQQLRARVQQLLAERSAPDGLRGALASELMGKDRGVVPRYLSPSVIQYEGNTLIAREIVSYRANGRVAVDVWLANPGPEAWTAAGAVLIGPKGEQLKSLPLWPLDPIVPGSDWGRIVVEVPATEKEARGTYTLKLWDADGQRTITIGNITFPE